jgi:hypothetical protein
VFTGTRTKAWRQADEAPPSLAIGTTTHSPEIIEPATDFAQGTCAGFGAIDFDKSLDQ